MSARTDALMSRQEAGKIAASIVSVMAGCHPARALHQHACRHLFPVFPEEYIGAARTGGAQNKRIDFLEHSSL
jgi:hypothetical protein